MDQYHHIRVLGRGSFATVALARLQDRENGPLRVIKEVDLARADDKRRADALHEAELLKSLSHPNIIAYHDAHLANARLCIVMEYADGGDLAASVARRRAASRRHHEREAMAIFVQLAMALDYIHQRRILHRDLKCQNVFLTRVGIVKLGDFGIARVLEAADSMAETRIGTPYYLPPEMCASRPYELKADIWCLGVVLYEVLALEVPFNAPSMAALVMKICDTEPRPVPQVYSSDLRSLLGRMMAKRPEDRPSIADIVALPHVRRGIAMLLLPGLKADAERLTADNVSAEKLASDNVSNASPKNLVTDLMSPNYTNNDCCVDPLAGPLVDLMVASRCCSPADEMPQNLDGNEQHCYMNNSLKQALESSIVCETLLRELEQEFNLT